MSSWLTLQEYSNRQGISISTLRRKIKREKIDFVKKNGRYLLKAPPLLSKEELKIPCPELLSQKSEELKKLKEEREDLLVLLNFLERENSEWREKAEWLESLDSQDISSPGP